MSKLPIPQSVTSRFTVKNVKNGFGHDKAGLYADIYLDNRKVGYFNDDGWGGGAEIRWDNKDTENILIKLLIEANFAQIMHDNGWDFLSVEELANGHIVEQCLDEIITQGVNNKLEEKEKNKFRKKMEKDMITYLVIGESLDSGSYRTSGWKGLTIEQVVKRMGVQKFVDVLNTQVFPKFKEGEKLLNTNLSALGVNISQ